MSNEIGVFHIIAVLTNMENSFEVIPADLMWTWLEHSVHKTAPWFFGDSHKSHKGFWTGQASRECQQEAFHTDCSFQLSSGCNDW